MYCKFAIFILSLLSFSATALESPQWPDAYARRDYKLGMSLTDFRNFPYPDQEKWPNSYPVCTDETRAKSYPYSEDLFISTEWEKAGVIKCTFFYDSKSMSHATSAGLVLGDINSHTEFSFISLGINSEPQLFYITSIGPTSNYEDLVLTFTEALGKPSNVKVEKLQTKVGAEFENEITTWSNKSSKVIVNRFGDTIQVLEVQHILTQLWNVFETNRAHARTEKSKKL